MKSRNKYSWRISGSRISQQKVKQFVLEAPVLFFISEILKYGVDEIDVSEEKLRVDWDEKA